MAWFYDPYRGQGYSNLNLKHVANLGIKYESLTYADLQIDFIPLRYLVMVIRCIYFQFKSVFNGYRDLEFNIGISTQKLQPEVSYVSSMR